ncbi:MAG: hypothetical protein AB1758_33850, partial [Candidatus Eremiobacterota bacterium]
MLLASGVEWWHYGLLLENRSLGLFGLLALKNLSLALVPAALAGAAAWRGFGRTGVTLLGLAWVA